ncbi:MAG: hypothetical protein IMW89_06075 [Ktedonobacteraceae bacterium]|nr:hypothetical protein [Ktedonobacteraceae bacterium]
MPARNVRYLAFLLLKHGRGGVIVGNPHAVLAGSNRQVELPYTGLEGYYAGSERTATRPGMTAEEIIREEAGLGAELLRTFKQRAIEQNTWAEFSHLQHVLDGKVRPDQDDLRRLQRLFGWIVGRLHARVYRNPEFALTLSEQIEQTGRLLGELHGQSEKDQKLRHEAQALYEELKKIRDRLSPAELEQERQERKMRERIRAERLAEFHAFRDETYQLLEAPDYQCYRIDVQDTLSGGATITESIKLPPVPGRQAYPVTTVLLTPEQVEGYLLQFS